MIYRKADLLEGAVDQDLVGLDAERGQVYGFNRTARRVWELLAEPLSLAQLKLALTTEFDADLTAVERDLMPFLARLEQQGLIETKPLASGCGFD